MRIGEFEREFVVPCPSLRALFAIFQSNLAVTGNLGTPHIYDKRSRSIFSRRWCRPFYHQAAQFGLNRGRVAVPGRLV